MPLRVRYNGGDAPRRWVFDFDQVEWTDAVLIEQTLGNGRTWDEWIKLLLGGDARSRAVLVWFLLRKDNPQLNFMDMPSFKMGDVLIEFGTKELVAIREEVEDNASLSPARKAALLATLDTETVRAALDEAPAADGDPKDPESLPPFTPDPDPTGQSTAPAVSPKSAKRSSVTSPRSATSRRPRSTNLRSETS